MGAGASTTEEGAEAVFEDAPEEETAEDADESQLASDLAAEGMCAGLGGGSYEEVDADAKAKEGGEAGGGEDDLFATEEAGSPAPGPSGRSTRGRTRPQHHRTSPPRR